MLGAVLSWAMRGATIINFMALRAFRPDGTVNDEKMATLLADPKLKKSCWRKRLDRSPSRSEQARAKDLAKSPRYV